MCLIVCEGQFFETHLGIKVTVENLKIKNGFFFALETVQPII